MIFPLLSYDIQSDDNRYILSLQERLHGVFCTEKKTQTNK